MSVIDLAEKHGPVEDLPSPDLRQQVLAFLGRPSVRAALLVCVPGAILSAAEGPPPDPVDCNKQHYYAAGALSTGQLVTGEMK